MSSEKQQKRQDLHSFTEEKRLELRAKREKRKAELLNTKSNSEKGTKEEDGSNGTQANTYTTQKRRVEIKSPSKEAREAVSPRKIMNNVIKSTARENSNIVEEELGGQEEVLEEASEQKELTEETSGENDGIDDPHANPATAPKKYNRKKKMRQRKRKIRLLQEKNEIYKAPNFQIHHPANDNSAALPKDDLKADITRAVMGGEGRITDKVSKEENKVKDLNTNNSSAQKERKYMPLSRRAKMKNNKIRLAKEAAENTPAPLYQIRRPAGSNSAFIPRSDFKPEMYGVRAEPRQHGNNRDAVMSWMSQVPVENIRQSSPIHLPSEEFVHSEGDIFYKREFPLKPKRTFDLSPISGMGATDHHIGGDIYETTNLFLGRREIEDNDEQLVAIAREALMQVMETGAPDFDQTPTRDGDALPETIVQEERMEGVGHGRSEYQEETEMMGMDVGSAEKSGRVTRMENIQWGRSLNFLREPLHRL